MTPIQTNKPVFFDLSGDVLEGGKIYIGQPSTDPRTNPKTVTFRDSGGAEFTASQPLKTKGGRIVYNGKPITALVDGDYSMLVLESSNAQVEYSGSVNPAAVAADDFGQLIRVGLTLADIKAYDVNVGETVRNVGKATATDNLGADWLVVSATGSPADDVDLIDFTNGLQGQRINNVVYRKDIGKADGNVPEISYQEVVIGGDFSNFTLACTKIGNLVSLRATGTIPTHASATSASSGVGAVPATFRPESGFVVTNVYALDGTGTAEVQVNSSGTLSTFYRDYSGTLVARSNAGGPVTTTYTTNA